MHVTLNDEQAGELESLIRESLRDMSHEIAATDNSHYRARLVARRHVLESAIGALHPKPVGAPAPRPEPRWSPEGERVWTVEIVFTENDDRTRADARMRAAQHEWHGWGRSRRNPVDPDVPTIGEELAAARALADLSHQLVEVAAHGVEAFEGHPVRLHG
ncbi:MAG TPA: dsRBD fold-containing protein [Acidimicrobiales bacterium]|nr:dsRBD fold-containing protein [Acidimicrobiales bacterium]